MYDSPAQRNSEIDEGEARSALELQIDLDTSADRLMEAFDALDESGGWDTPVELRGGTRVPARLLPLARLLEVVMHHVDLDIGYGMEDIDNSTAEWLLEWCSFRLRDREPLVDLLAEELDRAELVEPAAVPRDVVTMHSCVKFIDDDTGEARTATLVYPGEEDSRQQGKVAITTPVGSALLGLQAGATMSCSRP